MDEKWAQLQLQYIFIDIPWWKNNLYFCKFWYFFGTHCGEKVSTKKNTQIKTFKKSNPSSISYYHFGKCKLWPLFSIHSFVIFEGQNWTLGKPCQQDTFALSI